MARIEPDQLPVGRGLRQCRGVVGQCGRRDRHRDDVSAAHGFVHVGGEDRNGCDALDRTRHGDPTSVADLLKARRGAVAQADVDALQRQVCR
jgi:hypothetical protein